MFVRQLLAIALVLSAACLARAQTTPDPLATANALYAQGKFQESLDACLAVARADGRNAAAHHGAGMAYNALGQTASAIKAFERAYTLAPKDRAIVHNTALILFKNDAQPRALKLTKDYLVAVPKPFDEPMLETLRFMLETASDDTKKARLYEEANAFATQYARSLERERPGFVRWGAGWISAKDASEKAAANKKVDAEASVLADRIKLIERDMKNLDRRTAELESKVRRGFDPQYVLDRHLEQIRQLGDQRAEAMRERITVLERLARPAPATEPAMIALGTAAPEVPSIETLVSRTAPPPPPVPEPVAPQDKPAAPGDEPPIANNPPAPPGNVPPAPPEKVAKRVTRYGVAFAISQDTLVTSNDLVSGAFDITVQSQQGTTDEAKVIKSDPKTGLCLIRITKLKAAALRIAGGFDGGVIECVGMPNVDLFNPTASTINGKSPAPVEPWTVSLDKSPRLPGAPLLSGGKVVGVTLANRETEAGAVPAVTLQRLSDLVANDLGTRGAFTNDPKAAVFQIVATHESK